MVSLASPISSLAMYFPPSPFSRPDAVTCAGLVAVAYDQCTQWVAQDYPSSANFVWKPAQTPVSYTYSQPVFWTYDWAFVQYNEPFGFVAQAADGDTFLVLRGTVTDADIYQDARVDQTPYAMAAGYGSVHAGFHTIYQALSPQLRTILNGLSGAHRLLFAGHSLGSGLTTLAIPDVITNMSLKPSATLPMLQYNLASPRVGDPVFAGLMNRGPVPTFRIVNTEDLVPDGPPSVNALPACRHTGPLHCAVRLDHR